jgi:hypothetical protein
VQAIRQLDHEHADVLRHRDDHLAHRLGLRGVAVLDLVELGHAVDEHGDLIAELLGQLLERVLGVFDGVVQQRRGDRHGGHPQLGEDLGHRDGVGDVGLAAAPLLPPVGALGHGVGAFDHGEIGARIVAAHRAHQLVDGAGGGAAGEDPGHQSTQRRRAALLRYVVRDHLRPPSNV